METPPLPSFSQEQTLTDPNQGAPKVQRFSPRIRLVGWCVSALVLLFVFTVLKFPEIRLKAYIQGMINQGLAQKGISMSAESSELSFFLGITYTLKGVTLSLPPPAPESKIDKIQISPGLFSLLFKQTSAKIVIQKNKGTLKLKASSTLAPPYKGSIWFDADDFDLISSGILPALTEVNGHFPAMGTFELEGDWLSPETWSGSAQLDFKKADIEGLKIQGMPLPRIKLSEGKIRIKIKDKKATFTGTELGKANPEDDLFAHVVGDIQLAKTLESSNLALKLNFSLGQNILKSFALLDTLLIQGKTPEGSYAFNLSGPVFMPQFLPQAPNQK